MENVRHLIGILLLLSMHFNMAAQDVFTFNSATSIADNGTTTEVILPVSMIPTLMNSSYGLEEVCLDISHSFSGDLIISLVSPSGTEVLLTENNGSGSDYSITCFNQAAATSIASGTSPFNGDFLPEESLALFNINNEDPNGDWKLRILDLFPGDQGTLNSFTLQFSNNPAVFNTAQNNDCVSAEGLVVNASYTCSVEREDVTLQGATASGVTESCAFPAGTFDDDIWFTFTASSSVHEIRITNMQGDAAVLVGEVLQGSCNSLTSVDCHDFSQGLFEVSGLSASVQYFLRIASTSNNLNTTFTLCIKEGIPPPPSNDLCQNAIPISCSPITTGTIAGAGASGVSASCPTTLVGNFNDDVWFTFQASSTIQEISFSNVQGTSTALDCQILSGTCPSGLVEEFCYTGSGLNQSFIVGQLNIGNTYYLRLASFRTSDENTHFDLCVADPAPSSNPHDECQEASAEIPINPGSTCDNTITATLDGAQPSGGTEGCSSIASFNDDIWFSFSAQQAAYDLHVLNITGATSDLIFEVLTGSCSALTNVLCHDDPDELINLTGLVVGQDYFVRIASFSTSPQSTSFELCLTANTPRPQNDLLVNALEISSDCNTSTGGTLFGATASTNPVSNCSFNSGLSFNDDVWFVSSNVLSTSIQFEVDVTGGNDDLVFEIFKGPDTNNLQFIRCHDDPNTELIVSDLTIGQNCYLRIASFEQAAQTTTFNICSKAAPTPPSNDECSDTILYVIRDTSCAQLSLSFGGASASNQVESCSTHPFYNDVWIAFEASQSKEILEISNIVDRPEEILIQLSEGPCSTISELQCFSISEEEVSTDLILENLTPSTTYFLRFATYDFEVKNTTFDICIHDTIPIPPTNDECTSPISVNPTSTQTCSLKVSATLLGATASNGPNCTGSGGFDDDVWFDFTASEVSHVIDLENIAGTTQDLEVQVLDGSCGDLTELICFRPSSPGSGFSFEINDLTVSSNYLVRVASYEVGIQNVTFDICIHDTIPDPPANDDCINAVALTVSDYDNCNNKVSGTLLGATNSGITGGCNSTFYGNFDDDVWYEFEAAQITQMIEVSDISGTSEGIGIEVLDNCMSPTSIRCHGTIGDGTTKFGAGIFNIGETYYIRVSSIADGWENATFNICVRDSVPDPPANDLCAESVELIPQQGFTCTNSTPGTIAFATSSSLANSCTGGFSFDVWYHFLASQTAHVIELSNIIGSDQDLNFQVLAGSCGAFAEIGCFRSGSGGNSFSQKVSGLTIAETYYIRLGSPISQYADFNICMYDTIPDPPANDDCINAVTLTVSDYDNCNNKVSGSLSGATNSRVMGGCSTSDFGDFDDDVWYQFEADQISQVIEVGDIAGTSEGVAIEVLDDCMNPTSIRCHKTSGDGTTKFGAGPFAMGGTYYVRVASIADGWENVNFNICVRDTSPDPPDNDDCIGAFELIPQQGLSCTNSTSGTIAFATSSSMSYSCTGLFHYDVWYHFTPTKVAHTIELSNISSSDQDLNFQILDGSCGTFVEVACFRTGSGGAELAHKVSGLTVDQTYFIRLGSAFGGYTDFDICIRDTIPILPDNDECENATMLTVNMGETCTVSQSAALLNATASDISNTCSGTDFDDDIWYSFQADAERHQVSLHNIVGSSTTLDMQILDGSCSTFSLVACHQILGDSGDLLVENLSIGNTYYIRIASNESGNQSTSFDICISTPASDCSLLVTITDPSGPGSLREAVNCAEVGDTIRFEPSLSGQVIQLASPTINIDDDLVIFSDFAEDITVRNDDDANTDILINVQGLLTLSGLQIRGLNSESMIIKLDGGDVIFEDCEVDQLNLDKD